MQSSITTYTQGKASLSWDITDVVEQVMNTESECVTEVVCVCEIEQRVV